MSLFGGKLGVCLALLIIVALLWAPAANAKATSLGAVLGIVGIVVAVASCLAGCFGFAALLPAFAPAATALAVTSVAFPLVNTVTAVHCLSGGDSFAYTGCGGSGRRESGSSDGGATAGSGVGSVGTCTAGYYVCGNKSCVPFGSVCCASVGITDKYCPRGYACQADGTCKAGGTAAAPPTSSFSASAGGQSASAGGTLGTGVGNAVALSWSSTGATACSLDQGIGSVNASGSVTIKCEKVGDIPVTLTCTGEGGEVKKTITLACASIPVIKEIKPE